MERELAEMTGSFEQLAGMEEKEEEEESGSSVHGSESCLRTRVLVARVLFIDGARAFKHKKCILERKVCAVIVANAGQKESGVVEGVEVCDGRLGCVGVVKVWVTVLEMGQ